MWKLPSKGRTGRPSSGLGLKRTDRLLVGGSYGRGSRGRPSWWLCSAFTRYWFGGGFLCQAAKPLEGVPPGPAPVSLAIAVLALAVCAFRLCQGPERYALQSDRRMALNSTAPN